MARRRVSSIDARAACRAAPRRARAGRIHLAAPSIAVYPSFPRDSGGRFMDVEIREMPELRVGALRHIGPYNQIGEAFGRLGAIAGAAKLFDKPGAAMVALYHDDPQSTPADQLRSDAGVAVAADAALPPELVEHRVPA